MYRSEHAITSKHYLIFCISAFTVGILISAEYPQYCRAVKLAALFAVSAICAVFPLLRKFWRRTLRLKPFLFPCVLIVFALLGILRCESFDRSHSAADDFTDSPAWFYGRVVSPPSVSENYGSARFEINLRAAESGGNLFKLNDDIMLLTPAYSADEVSLNDTVIFWGTLTSVNSPDTKFSDAYLRFLKSKNLLFTAKAKNLRQSEIPPYTPDPFDLIRRAGIRIHIAVVDACDDLFSSNPRINSLMKGMLIGDKSDFSPELYSSMSNSGMSHITAVSGMHMSILFSSVTYLFTLGGSDRRRALLFTVPVIVLFAAASAFTPSVCRSAVMLLVMILSSVCGQRYDPLTGLFLALGLIVCNSPYAIFSAGLLLSFGAAFGILVFCKYISALLKHTVCSGPLFGLFTESLAVSLSSFICTSFFSAYFFNKISLMQFVTNIWIIPAVTVTFCLGYVACIVYFIFPAVSMHLIRYFAFCGCGIISKTADLFGTGIGSLYVPVKALSNRFGVIWAGVCVLLYFTLKLLYDNSRTKETYVKEYKPVALSTLTSRYAKSETVNFHRKKVG